MIQFLLVIQVMILLGGIVFLWQERRIIKPAGTWWSFAARDLLWLFLIVDQLANILGVDIIGYDLQLVIQTVIVGLLAYSMYARYKVQQQARLYDERRAEYIKHLEDLRAREQWNPIADKRHAILSSLRKSVNRGD